MQNGKLFAIVLPIFLLNDLFWLGTVMKEFYSQELGELARRNGVVLAPRWGAAMRVYPLIPVGIVLLVRLLTGENAPPGRLSTGEHRSCRRFMACMT